MSNEHPKDIQKELQKEYSKIVAKTWCDPEYREKFLENPIPILNDHGFNIPDDAEIKINTDTPPSGGMYHFNLPLAPEGLNCTAPELLGTCEGVASCCCCCCC
ncbi:hypothetical protein [Bacillus cereus]|uniref:hypothetical protein n=1 Tax=Bacillus cereus group TaxID=86661 RepID=UPI00099490CB|nr:hypothetical protein [Bacillus cereus]OPA26079.1 hypothetical protein BHL53_06560 [Bacillus cereus]